MSEGEKDRTENIGKLCRKLGGNALCYCVREGDDAGKLVFYTGKFGHLMTWWDFDRHGVSVDAYINGKLVCQGHSTSHIIDYDVIGDAGSVVEHDDGSVSYFFTMSLRLLYGVNRRCVFRCWDAQTDWKNAPLDRRAEVHGNINTVARFELHRGADYKWTLKAL